jgi:hypothetical protein
MFTDLMNTNNPQNKTKKPEGSKVVAKLVTMRVGKVRQNQRGQV